MTNNSQVFVVDDDDPVRDSIQVLLASAGFTVLSFASAKDFLAAWHLADKDRPELAEMRALAR